MQNQFQPIKRDHVNLSPGMMQQRFALNRKYMMSLSNENLLQNFYSEAGLWAPPHKPVDCHWGWESPTSQVRGHFLGHWLSGAAMIWAETGDAEIKAKADHIVAELARCQRENGGEWVGSIPTTYLDWVARNKGVWAPHYTLHKTLMGLFDMYSIGGNTQALDVLVNSARWFSRWTEQFTRSQMDDILDVETGGMIELWANLYDVTGRQEHLDLMHRYDRPRLFDRLINGGEDVLTNMHANTTIPEVQGAARAWEVTGDSRWRNIVDAYWRFAVTQRGTYCTGGQTCGEIWTPSGELAARLGDKNQEHCVVYNMMRLAEYLLTWTGDIQYADYWERNLYNGILAQQHPTTGMIAYFLPLQPGAFKKWGSPTDDFWCCHGTLVQAQTLYSRGVYCQTPDGLALCQYIPTELRWDWQGTPVTVSQKLDTQTGSVHRPANITTNVTVTAAQLAEFALSVRLPWWLKAAPIIEINGVREDVPFQPSSYYTIKRIWHNDRVRIVLPKGLSTAPLPDEPDTVAFMDGPVVLAGITDEERMLYGDKGNPASILKPDNEREWTNWIPTYKAHGQPRGLRFIPLYEVRDERYSVYFPIQQSSY
jgi:DUF1680 family protein